MREQEEKRLRAREDLKQKIMSENQRRLQIEVSVRVVKGGRLTFRGWSRRSTN